MKAKLVFFLSFSFCIVTHRLGSSTASRCKYRELVLEVQKGAIIRLFPQCMHRADCLPVGMSVEVTKAFTSGVSFLFLS